MRHRAALLTALLLAAAVDRGTSAASNDDCLACHGERSLSAERRGRQVSLFVDREELARSPHASLACTDCHRGFNAGNIPHRARIDPVDCAACHGDAPAAHPFHPQLAGGGKAAGRPGSDCRECHGSHGVERWTGTGGAERSARLLKLCGGCHGDVAASFTASEHGRAAASGGGGAPDCIACHLNPINPDRARTDPVAYKRAQEKLCLSCHLDSPEVRARTTPTAGFIAAYDKSVHGAALQKGNAKAASCVDCHGSHEMRKGFDPASRVGKSRQPATCGACHGEIARTFEASVHGAALRKGNTDAPVCTDCHGEHNILKHNDPASPVAARNVSQKVCSPCHSSVKFAQKYGIQSDRFRSFSDSYHGLALSGGDVEAANCASCHGTHNILPSSDPASTINKANLAATCGRCHPGANERFGAGSVHLSVTPEKEPVLYWIASLYLGMILATVGGMAAHNILDFLKKARHRQKVRRGQAHEEPAGHALYVRMTLPERLQHASLMVSFTLLVLTGFMLRYPDAWWVAAIRSLSDHVFGLRSLLHRIAAVVMVAASMVHVGYIAFVPRGRQLIRDLFPARKDAYDAIGNVAYMLGLSQTKPRFDRFSYIEKAEYWALVWGTIVMAVTGSIMWFENIFIGILGKLGWDIARTVHFWEAWLATLAILVWHIYFVVFNPDAYPMNLAWINGRISEAEMREEHPLEFERLERMREEEEMRAQAEIEGRDRGAP